ncbi:MAG: efflux RND transporter periplasmic adaptor subunit [bacterium]
MKTNQIHLLRICGVGLTPIFCSLFLTACNRQPKVSPKPPLVDVATIVVMQKPILLTTELPGRTSPYLIAEVRPQVSGLIQKRLFTEGSDVKAGQKLYEIDPAPFQAAMDHARATLEAARKAADQTRAALNAALAGVARQQATVTFARTNRKRFEDLLKEKAVSTSDSEQAVTAADVAEATLKATEAEVQSAQGAVAAAEAAIQQATAAVEIARINLAYTQIVAPISGRIGKSTVTDGAIVTAYQPVTLATIQQMDPIYVDVPQSTAEMLRLKRRLEDGRIFLKGTDLSQVRIMQEDGTAYPLEGVLQFRDVSVDPTTGSVILRMVFPNPEGALLPGMFVRAVIREGINEKAMLVPQQAVSRDPKGNPMALVVNATQQVEPRRLSLDRAFSNQWIVASGLVPGDRVIVEGMQKVRPGAEVKAVPFEESTTQSSKQEQKAPSASTVK